MGSRLGFPKEQTVQLVYSDTITQSGASGIAELHHFRLNSCYDPDYTATGHQPLGFDQWSLFYNHYVVTEIAWEIQCQPAATGVGVLTAVHVSDDTTFPTSLTHMGELGAEVALSNVYYGHPLVSSGVCKVKDFLNRPSADSLRGDSELRATVGANPAEVIFLTLGSQSPTSVSHTTQWLVRLVQTVVFMEPKDLAGS